MSLFGDSVQRPVRLGGVSRIVCNTLISRILWMYKDSSRHTTNLWNKQESPWLRNIDKKMCSKYIEHIIILNFLYSKIIISYQITFWKVHRVSQYASNTIAIDSKTKRYINICLFSYIISNLQILYLHVYLHVSVQFAILASLYISKFQLTALLSFTAKIVLE